MKKIVNILIISILIICITGCSIKIDKNNSRGNKNNNFEASFNNGVKGKAYITKSGENKVVRVEFERQKENSKVKVLEKYYKDGKEVYNFNAEYIFPDENSECIMEIPIVNKYLRVKDGVSDEALKDKDNIKQYTEEVKFEYDKIKLTVTK